MKVVLALVALQFVVGVRSLPPIDLVNFCNDKADGYYCASCLQPVYCNTTNFPSATELPPCGYEEACETFSTTLASCVSSSSATYCDCYNEDTICDPYNENYIVTCDYYYDYVEDVTICDNITEKVCRDDTCVARASCSGISNGTWVRYYPVCTVAYECAFDRVVAEKTCEYDEYVTDDGDCASAPPSPCSDDCYGNCSDATDCTRYYFCDGVGNVLSGPLDCPTYSYFNPNSSPPMCVANDTSVCNPLTACNF